MQLRRNYSDVRTLMQIKQLTTPSFDKDKEVFLYSTLHDLKSPVNNIEGLTHILKNELSTIQSEEIKIIIEKIEQCVSLTQAKINELTASAKFQAEPYEDKKPVGFEELLEEVIAENEMAIQSSQVVVEHSFSVAQIIYSRSALKSILLNLITNSIKYRSPLRSSTIQLVTKKRNGKVLLSVTDNGLGIDLSKKENKLFQIFKRLHNHVEGTGLGLYLIKKIVERAGGKIKVSSQLNVGTSFEVTF